MANLFFSIVAFSCDSFQAHGLSAGGDDDRPIGPSGHDGYDGFGSGSYINYDETFFNRRHLTEGGVSFGYMGAKVDGTCVSWDDFRGNDGRDAYLKGGLAVGVLGTLLGWCYFIVVVVIASCSVLTRKFLTTLGAVMGPLMTALTGCLYLGLSATECREREISCTSQGKGHLIAPACVCWVAASVFIWYIQPREGSDNMERSDQSIPMEERIAEKIGRRGNSRILICALFVTWIFWNVAIFDCSSVRAFREDEDYKDGYDFGLFRQADYDKNGDRYACIAYHPDMPKNTALNYGRAFGAFGFIFHTLALFLALSMELCLSSHVEVAWKSVRGLIAASTICSPLIFIALANEDCADDNGLQCRPGPGGIIGICNIFFMIAVMGLSLITKAPLNTLFVRRISEQDEEAGEAAEAPKEGKMDEASGTQSEVSHVSTPITAKSTPTKLVRLQPSNSTSSSRAPKMPSNPPRDLTPLNKEKSVEKTFEVQYKNFKGAMGLLDAGVIFQETSGTDAIRYRIPWGNVRKAILNKSHTKLKIIGTPEVCDGVAGESSVFLLAYPERAIQLRDGILQQNRGWFGLVVTGEA